ncbi:hypothetical protein EJV47_26265 [Hymenobacter gummosus]|uniref:Uncharacterized protein n=1 Tax=Hymenobacter gummosus TaxID=1776032 RepID=A0A431TV18_9BACT|nr:hypothetical protein [Hymenobacter gummosus]RTQ45078.1 hypothetical protein EJV47_26265 [Hymenobacter gummosus]
MTRNFPTPSNELAAVTNTIGQAVQASTSAFRFLGSLKGDTRAVLVLLLSVCGLLWAINYFSTKR